MNIEIVDQIPSVIEGAPPKLIGQREDGAFGLVSVQASAAKLEGRTLSLPKPMLLSDVIDRARAIVAGQPRAATEPGIERDLAVSVLAVAAQLGRVAMLLDETAKDALATEEDLCDAEGLLQEAAEALAAAGPAELRQRIGEFLTVDEKGAAK